MLGRLLLEFGLCFQFLFFFDLLGDVLAIGQTLRPNASISRFFIINSQTRALVLQDILRDVGAIYLRFLFLIGVARIVFDQRKAHAWHGQLGYGKDLALAGLELGTGKVLQASAVSDVTTTLKAASEHTVQLVLLQGNLGG